MKQFFENEGLHVIYAKKINTHGGSIRIYASKSNLKIPNNNINKIISQEKKLNSKNLNKFKKLVIQSKVENIKMLGSILKK